MAISKKSACDDRKDTKDSSPERRGAKVGTTDTFLGGAMKDLLDLKKIWDWIVTRWKESFGWIVICLISFVFGMQWQQKETTDDCRIMGSFRDNTQAYSCQVRVR